MENRDFFSKRIQKSLLGPGSDVFALPEIEEIINDYPLQRYYTGILFPEKAVNTEETDGREEFDGQKENDESDDEIENTVKSILEQKSKDDENDQSLSTSSKSTKNDGFIPANQYFPTNLGLTFCVAENIESIQAEISGAVYENANFNDVRIEFSKEEKEFLFHHLTVEFKEKLDYENNMLFFKKEPEGKTKGGRSGDYAVPQQLRRKDELKDRIEIIKLERLLSPENRLWKRNPFLKNVKIDLTKEFSSLTILQNEKGKLDLFVKIIEDNKKHTKYIKLLLHNASEAHAQNSFTNSNPNLNEKTFFQVQISVKNNDIQAYKQPSFAMNEFDPEANLIHYQYRSIKEYAIGHGCAIQSKKTGNEVFIETTFLPEVDIPKVSNKLKDNPFFEKVEQTKKKQLEQIMDMKNLSIWSEIEDTEILTGLEEFVEFYSKWIVNEQAHAENEPEYLEYSNELIKKQEITYERLKSNIDLLRNNSDALSCFKYANTAMYIQLILSTDERFAKKHKDLKEINADSNIYDNLDFFQNYIYPKEDQEPFTYHPFQLAFFLLNLNSIVNNTSEERDLVDLLWFPTGGGKTEAYLAVSAFTIFWRRMQNPNDYNGVSVIMRYTLRLLTAQQFERASRLISALEFLRAETNLFGKERITIGMWVGSATTPNSYQEAQIVQENIQNQINRLNQGQAGNPEEKNSFQIKACPWCGCKTISKLQNGNYSQAFDVHGQAKCLNDDCHFSDFGEGIPVYVVDDFLYNKPPTLLFATVDKFAMLSHKAEGGNFFHSTDTGLPPDLIIQDELHLLNGPLGSIVGLFERVIESLCTKNGIKPKIIASTATTRNTDLQIRNLYNRDVAIFPPSGIHYNDSFFAFTLSESRRKYIGFMPTGKTGTVSQLELISHILFARAELLQNLRQKHGENQEQIWTELDQYFTLVSYYNSLRDIGKTYNKVNAEIYDKIRLLHQRHFLLNNSLFNFMYYGLISRTRELTSRIPSNKITTVLDELDTKLKIQAKSKDEFKIEKGVDLVLASNMISVGIDVGRLNLMLMNGMPRNIAEYIQASSRVARSNEGIVFNLLDANRAREKSYFENYQSFHHAYYKFVEPLSLTPFTEITFDRMLNSLLVCYVRHKQGKVAHDFIKSDTNNLKTLISQTITEPDLLNYLTDKLNFLSKEWLSKIDTADSLGKTLQYTGKKHALISKSEPWNLMYSMREIDKQGVIIIQN